MNKASSRKRVGVLLSGCGVFDGSEIHEAVLTLLALEKIGAEAVCIAPDKDQHHVVDHLTGQPTGERRNVLAESARIARGQIENLAGVTAKDLDALILPGGFGAAKNLSTFAMDGAKASVEPDVARLVEEMFAARKPVGLICIAPAVGARILGQNGVEVTIGTDEGTAAAIEAMGARHVACGVREVHADEARRVVSTPAYMLGRNIAEVAEGIEKLVQVVVEWIP